MNRLMIGPDGHAIDARRVCPRAAVEAAWSAVGHWMALNLVQDELEELARSRDPTKSRMGVEGLAGTVAAGEVARRLAYSLVGLEDQGTIFAMIGHSGRIVVELDDLDRTRLVL